MTDMQTEDEQQQAPTQAPAGPQGEPQPPAPEAAAPAPAAAEAARTEAQATAEAPAAGEAPRAERPEGERAEGERRPERRRRHFGRRKVCAFCVEKATSIDYKDPAKLRRYLSDRGRIDSRRKTGTCAKHQRWLAVALKRARHLALLPYTPEHIRVSGTFPTRR